MNEDGYITVRVEPVPNFADKWMDFVLGDILKGTAPRRDVTVKTF
jgi:hypothetical protein